MEGFSDNSRRRYRRKLARVGNSMALPLFVTLTYPDTYPHARIAKQHERTLWKRIERAFPQGCATWRLDLQERGAPHFHLLVWGVPWLPKRQLQRMWASVIGVEGADTLPYTALPFTRVERAKSGKQVSSYVSHYMAHVANGASLLEHVQHTGVVRGPARFFKRDVRPGDAVDVGFNNLTYLTAPTFTMGRFWGIHNARAWLWARLDELSRPMGAWFYQFRRACRRHCASIGGRWGDGWAMFTADPYRWHRYAEMCAG